MDRRRATGVVALALAACTRAYAQSLIPNVSGTLESYFVNNPQTRGVQSLLWYGQLDYHPSNEFNFDASYFLYPGGNGFDELYARAQIDRFSVRVGRIWTQFGLDSWADLYYTGFNQLPLVRQIDLVGDEELTRQDSGAEVTYNNAATQVTGAIFDDNLGDNQVLPEKVDHASLRVQQGFGAFIGGLDFLSSFDGDEKVYGFDGRFTEPNLIVRAEGYWGQGAYPAYGYYIDGSYRIPKLYRTQVVTRFEQAKPWNTSLGTLTTMGIRQGVTQYLSLNLNYSFGTPLTVAEYGQVDYTGWSVQAMLRFAF
jgi:hypothetical protein